MLYLLASSGGHKLNRDPEQLGIRSLAHTTVSDADPLSLSPQDAPTWILSAWLSVLES